MEGSTDEDTLLNLNIDYLLSICQSNEYLNGLCQDDMFWKKKIIRDFSPELVQYKPDNETYRDQYLYLINSDIDHSIEDCRLDGIILNSQHLLLNHVIM